MPEKTAVPKFDVLLHHTIFNLAGDAIVACSDQGIAIECNEAALNMFGCTREQLLGSSPVDWSPEFQPDGGRSDQRADEIFARVRAQGEVRFEWECRRTDGSLLPLDVTVRFAQTGTAVLFVFVARNVTERRQAEDVLKASEEKYRALVETTGTGYMIVDRGGVVIDANPEYVRMTGHRDLPDILGRSFIEWTAEHHRELNGRAFEQCMKDGYLRNLMIDYADTAGRIISIEFNATVIGTGDSLRIIAICRDITEIKKVEQQAAAASRTKSAFLANMSHEIRTPLNVIVGFAENLYQEVNTAEERYKLQKIQRAADHLLGIINDVLDMSKIEAGKLVVNAGVFDLRDLLHGVRDYFLPQALDKGLELRLEIALAIPACLRGDDLRLRQCLFNYLSNALKFTVSGNVTLRVALDRRTDSGFLLRFEVADTGIGIEPQVQNRLFSTFEQADVSTTREFGGTGLGLALTRQLAKLMGGEAGVESTHGKGSRFWFTAELKDGAEAEVNSAETRNAEEPPTENFSHARVLVAEDVETNREVLSLLLSKVGLVADMAENGDIAVKMAKSLSYDLILMDMRMPVIDGLSATRIIRTLPGYADTPIIALTANAFDEDQQLCLDAGMDDFLSKPLRFGALVATLSKWLRE